MPSTAKCITSLDSNHHPVTERLTSRPSLPAHCSPGSHSCQFYKLSSTWQPKGLFANGTSPLEYLNTPCFPTALHTESKRFHGWKARALWPLPPFPLPSLNPHVHWGPATLVPSCSLKHTTAPTSVPLHLLLLEPGMFFPWAVAQLTMTHSDSLQHHFLREASSDRHPPPSATVIFTRVSLSFMTPITAPEVISKSCICLSHHKLCEN